MAQIVPGPANIGQQLGSGLSAGLSALAEQKFSQLARREIHRERASRLHALGLNPREADYLAGIDDKYGFAGVNQFYNSGGGQGQPSGEQTPQQQAPQQQMQQQPNLEQLSSAPSIPGAHASPEQLMLQSLATGNPLTPIQATLKSIEAQQAAQQGQQYLGGGQSQPQVQTQQPGSTEQEEMMMGQAMPPELKEMIAQQRKQQPSAFGAPAGRENLAGGVKPQQQAQIDRSNAPFNKDLDKRAGAAKELLEISDRMESLVQSGKVSSGPWGAIQQRIGKVIPQSPETEQFDSDASAAAILKASLIPGVVTNERLKAAERTKPSINQTEKSQIARIKVMRDDALTVLAEDEARSQIIEENGGNQPPNMRQLVEKRAKEIKKEVKEIQKVSDLKVGSSLNSLPDPSLVPQGTVIEDDKGNEYIVRNGRWVKK